MTQQFNDTGLATDTGSAMAPDEPLVDHIALEEPALKPNRAGRTTTMWFRFPRLRRQKGLATGIIGLW